MRNAIILFILTFYTGVLWAQKEESENSVEVMVSFNRTNLKDQNTENGNGFGLGLYQTFLMSKKVKLIFGLEYNKTTQTKNRMYGGHYAHTTDIKYSFNWFSIPLNARVYFGERFKFFIESGAFVDIPLSARKKGTSHSCLPNEEGHPEYKTNDFDEKASQIRTNLGLSVGLGFMSPISNTTLIIKSDYRYGLRPIHEYYDKITNKYYRISVGMKI
ncbi:outer membrane beta-barrel protein [Lentimicrobium sp. S6]|uniref:outer membrane beta-barrel protein n=1 Tax=Lentimicrobium sp. S6 TaxID=2735872 RepID=UPI0015557F1E|nr:outer membrane beta-barrel protein [Lentimicrobium sp. S6]NPD44107.1 outer membrane beta-barrel protein [Lentimicrobium sp. S6]